VDERAKMGSCCVKPEGEILQAGSLAEPEPAPEVKKADEKVEKVETPAAISPGLSENSASTQDSLETRDRSSAEAALDRQPPERPHSERPRSWRISLKKHDEHSVSEESEKNKRLSRFTNHPLAHEHVRDVVAHVLGQKKDQDRAVCVPALVPGVLYCGVFDGHGRNGEIRSELATTELPRLIKRELKKALDEGRQLTEKDIHEALDTSYDEFHSQLDTMYEETVYKRAVEAATARQRTETGDPTNEETVVPDRMPQDGGTTATSVIISGEVIVVGWVGDSRAVLARRIAKKRGPILNRFSSRLKISTLTEDHNVATNITEEMQRVAEQGGEIYGKHLAAGTVEGMLQLTRSLGDSPFHRTGLVVSKPGIVTIPIVDDNVDPLLFLLVASDGLWDYFSNKEALSFVYKKLKKDGYADEQLAEKRSQMLTDCARALEAEAVRRSNDRKSHSDDITVLLITFTKGWGIEAEDSPSF